MVVTSCVSTCSRMVPFGIKFQSMEQTEMTNKKRQWTVTKGEKKEAWIQGEKVA